MKTISKLAAILAATAFAVSSLLIPGCGPRPDVRDRWPVTIDGGAWPSSSHVQGIAVDKKNGFIYWSYATRIVKTDLHGEVLGTVEGILGHLGCMAFNEEDGKVYASLEYSDDDIQKGILSIMKSDRKFDVAFFVAIIDGNKIDSVGMDASESGIIEAVLLPKVVEDYKAVVDGKSHRYGCSGIDGVSFGPAFGKTGGEKFLTVAYGIYGDTTRTDNDSQILHQYSMDSIRTYKEVFSQDNMPKDGPAPTGEYFVHTGNTTYGVQNLCWDPDSKNWLMFVYRGKKSAFPNGTLYIADGRKAPVPDAEGKMTVPLVEKGCLHEESGIRYWESRLGDTGTASIGDGYFYMAEGGRKYGLRTARIHLMKWTGNTPDPFEKVAPKPASKEGPMIDTVLYNPATDWMKDAGVGAFMHFLPGSTALVEQFDVDALVEQLSDAGVRYFYLTLGQNDGVLNAPNPVYDSISRYKAGERTSRRDLPMELGLKLKEKGIRFLLYLPCQTPNLDRQAVWNFGFEDEKGADRVIVVEGDRDRFISMEGCRNWAKVINWWSAHYGDLVSGWWFDGGYEWCGFNDERAQIYAHAVKDANPGAVVTFNPGCSFKRWTCAEDYTAGEINEPLEVKVAGRWKGGSQAQILTYLGPSWGRRECRFSDDEIVPWVQSVVANGGAVTFDVGPNYDPAAGPVGAISPEQAAQLKLIVSSLKD